MPSLRHVIAATAAASFVSATVAAQPAPTPDQPPAPPGGAEKEGDVDGGGSSAPSERPWAKGVSPDDQKAANALFKEGNALLRDSFFVQAVEKYRAAVTHWDHPAIHYNLAIALINLDQPLEVYTSLEKALQYGTLALDQEKIELGERYKKLVEQQLVWVTVSCTEPDAQVYIDGKEAFRCPAEETRLVRAGEHTFTANKPQFETTALTRVYPGGTKERVELRLYRPEDLTGYQRKFDAWIPYAVLGAGVAVAGLGGLLHASAAGSYDDYDAQVRACERETQMACTIDDDLQGLRDSGDTKQTLAFASYAIGGAAIAGGVALLVINRAKPYRKDIEGLEAGEVAVTPVIAPGGVGVSASLRW